MSLFKTGPVPHPDGVKVTTSGAAHDWLSIPAWVRRITISLVGVSTNGTSALLLRLGDAGGIEDSGYLGADTSMAGSVVTAAYSSGFLIQSASAANVLHGVFVLTLHNAATFAWAEEHHISSSNAAQRNAGSGSKTLTEALDRVRLTTVNGTDAFDLGSAALFYE